MDGSSKLAKISIHGFGHLRLVKKRCGMSAEQRPELSADMSAEEFERWYWMKAELTQFASKLGLRSSGGKQDVAARISR